MTAGWLVLGAVLCGLLLAWYAVWTAGRIDRLHHRVAAARARVEVELARRAALVAEITAGGELDPASSLLLLDAAHRARTASDAEREQAESALTRALAATHPAPAVWAAELASVARRVQMARRFHNDLVVAVRNLRGRRLARWFRLAGHAPWPSTIELDDGSAE